MEFDEFISDFGKESLDDTFQKLGEIGSEALEISMQTKTFQDVTGNLSASIGYTVIRDGQVIEKGGFKGTDIGASKGRTLAVGSDGLHFVAGMDYATCVEAKGKDVNTAGELLIDQYVEQS